MVNRLLKTNFPFVLIAAILITPAFASLSYSEDIDISGLADDFSKSLQNGFTIWAQTISFKNVIINGPNGILLPGGMVHGHTNSIFQGQFTAYSSPSRNETTRYLHKAIILSIAETLNMWAQMYTNNLIQFPQGASCPGPILPPTPNTPILVSAGTPNTISSSLSGVIRAYFLSHLGRPPNDVENICFEALKRVFLECFTLWTPGALIQNIMGQGGRNPLWIPPSPQPGPVINASGSGGKIAGNFCSQSTIRTRIQMEVDALSSQTEADKEKAESLKPMVIKPKEIKTVETKPVQPLGKISMSCSQSLEYKKYKKHKGKLDTHTYDLGKEFIIKKVSGYIAPRPSPEKGARYSWFVQVSLDGKIWRNIGKIIAARAGERQFSLSTDIKARYLRIFAPEGYVDDSEIKLDYAK